MHVSDAREMQVRDLDAVRPQLDLGLALASQQLGEVRVKVWGGWVVGGEVRWEYALRKLPANVRCPIETSVLPGTI
jgi:hypothetical protein